MRNFWTLWVNVLGSWKEPGSQRIGYQTSGQVGVVTKWGHTTVNCDVHTFLTNEFSNSLGDILVLLEIDRLDSELLLSELKTEWNTVDSDYSRCAFDLCPLGGAQADWAQSLDGTFKLER